MTYQSFMFARSNTGTVPVAVSELAGRGMIDRVSRVCQVLRKHHVPRGSINLESMQCAWTGD